MPQIVPLKQWFCDVCGEIIESPEKGYVIYHNDQNHKDHGFKIIHQSRCDLKDHHSSMSLDTFLGSEGLAWLTSMLSIGPIKLRLGQKSGPDVRDMHEFMDFFRRCQTPYYEEARRYFNDEDILDRFSDANEVYPYLPDVLEMIVHEKSGRVAMTTK